MSYPGSTAKVRMIQALAARFAAEPSRTFRVLDVGVTGPQPLTFWQPLFTHRNFELTGVDVDAPSIEALKATKLPAQVKALEALTGYDIASRFGKASFDMVVSTQVLEHMRYPERFLAAAKDVLVPGGDLHLCYDNGLYHRQRESNHLKEFAKQVVVRLTGSERFHDKDLKPAEVRAMLERVGFRIESDRLYNIHPLKDIHGHETPAEHQDAVMERWLALEDLLNDIGHAAAYPKRYLVSCIHAVKP